MGFLCFTDDYFSGVPECSTVGQQTRILSHINMS